MRTRKKVAVAKNDEGSQESNHLVPEFGGVSIEEARDRLDKALKHLAKAANESMEGLAKVADCQPDWALRFKRYPVAVKRLPDEGDASPAIVNAAKVPLAELVNLCATMVRTRDALAWAAAEAELNAESKFNEARVKVCHPTTSSAKKKRGNNKERDNDIVLCGKNGAVLARFEVSDVASKKDGNGKTVKDLCSLGLLEETKNDKGKSPYKLASEPPKEVATYLVVSCEFSKYVYVNVNVNSSRESVWRDSIQRVPVGLRHHGESLCLNTVIIQVSIKPTS